MQLMIPYATHLLQFTEAVSKDRSREVSLELGMGVAEQMLLEKPILDNDVVLTHAGDMMAVEKKLIAIKIDVILRPVRVQ